MRKILPLLLTLLLLAAGCRKEGFVPYSGQEMAQVLNGTFTTDEGVKLVVDGNAGNYDIHTARRVLVRYQATAIGTDGSYTIDLQELWETTITDPFPASDPVGVLSDDPVRIDEAWFSGGYLNLTVAFPAVDSALHDFPLSFAIDGKKAVLRLYHDAREDVPSNVELKQACLCFPLKDITAAYPAPSDGSKTMVVPVLLQWRWYGQEEDAQTVILYEKEGSYRASR